MEGLFVLACALGCLAIAIGGPMVAIISYGLHKRKRVDQEIATREQQVSHLLTATTTELGPGRNVALVVGSIVYAPDAAARNANGWRQLVGGRSVSVGLRMEAARRLATVRALEQASQFGAQAVLNLRYETSQLSQSSSNNRSRQQPLIEIVAYGTAWVPA